ncbi:MAG: DUF397 domain-containing protein [Pseudonocardiaceae bacterium]
MTKGGASGSGQVPVHWRKSSYSGTSGNCIEVAGLADGPRAVRDSKDPHGPALIFTPAEWAAFTAGVRAGEFD